MTPDSDSVRYRQGPAPRAPAAPADPAPRARRKPRARPPIFTHLEVTAEQVERAMQAVLAGAAPHLQALQPLLPHAFLSGKVAASLSQRAVEFTASMAALKEAHGELLGPLRSDPGAMRSDLALSAAVQTHLAPLRALLLMLENIGNFSAQRAFQEARVIYQHAVASALVNPTVADAIAPLQAARTQRGKEGVLTRTRNRQGLAAAASEAVAQSAVPSMTTTVTTAQR